AARGIDFFLGISGLLKFAQHCNLIRPMSQCFNIINQCEYIFLAHDNSPLIWRRVMTAFGHRFHSRPIGRLRYLELLMPARCSMIWLASSHVSKAVRELGAGLHASSHIWS